MEKVEKAMIDTAKKLLEEKKVDVIIGFEKGNLPLRTIPVFISKPEDADVLVWNSFCDTNIAKFLMKRIAADNLKRRNVRRGETPPPLYPVWLGAPGDEGCGYGSGISPQVPSPFRYA